MCMDVVQYIYSIGSVIYILCEYIIAYFIGIIYKYVVHILYNATILHLYTCLCTVSVCLCVLQHAYILLCLWIYI